MKILYIADFDAWDIVSYQVLHMSQQLNKLGHRVSLLCPKDSRLYAEAQKAGIDTRPLTFLNKLGFLSGSDYEILHFFETSSLSALPLGRLHASAKVFVSQIRFGDHKILMRLKAVEQGVTRFLVSCPSVQEALCLAGINPAKTFIVPPAIKISRWESAMLIKPSMFLKRPYKVGIVSLDRTLKEQGLFLRAAKEVLITEPNTNFAVVGLADERIRTLARELNISHKVDVLWDRNDMPEVMAMLHIFVKATETAGLSMSLIEAQAAGVPTIVPKLQGLADFITHERNGLIFQSGSENALAKAILYLINNPALCHTMSKVAYDQVNFNMSLPVVSNLLLRLYEDAFEDKAQ